MSELLVICVVALIAVGPKKLPGMLHQLGQWIRKLRNMTNDMRSQTGIDDLLRSEGLHGGLNELRGLLRGNHGISFDPPHVTSHAPVITSAVVDDPYANVDIDTSREYPLEGADAYGALPDDLIEDEVVAAPPPVATDTAPVATDTAPSTNETTEPV
jgi:sec-independent protein translocase protein TatB